MDPMDPTNSYGFLRILQSSIDSNYFCVSIVDLRTVEFVIKQFILFYAAHTITTILPVISTGYEPGLALHPGCR